MVDGGRMMEQQALAAMQAQVQRQAAQDEGEHQALAAMQAQVQRRAAQDEGMWTDALDMLVDSDATLKEAAKSEEGTLFHSANVKRLHARKREGNAQKTMLRGFEKGTMKIKTDSSPLIALGMLQSNVSGGAQNHGRFQAAKRYHRPPTVTKGKGNKGNKGKGVGTHNLVIR
jgi:hypothetical protein